MREFRNRNVVSCLNTRNLLVYFDRFCTQSGTISSLKKMQGRFIYYLNYYFVPLNCSGPFWVLPKFCGWQILQCMESILQDEWKISRQVREDLWKVPRFVICFSSVCFAFVIAHMDIFKGINLLTFYLIHECCSLIGYATHDNYGSILF